MNISEDLEKRMLELIIFKSKYVNLFEEFNNTNIFGDLFIMTAEEEMFRNVIELLNLQSRQEAIDRLEKINTVY